MKIIYIGAKYLKDLRECKIIHYPNMQEQGFLAEENKIRELAKLQNIIIRKTEDY